MSADIAQSLGMASSTASTVRLGSGPRTVLARPDVGAAGHTVQRSDLTSRRVVVDQATLILVEEGRKRIRWSGGECAARPGDALSLHPGEVVDIANTPGRSGTYRALWICWYPELLAAPSARRRPSPRVALHSALGDDFRASFYRAFDSLSERDGLPASITVHRLQEVLLWLGERGFHFPLPAPASLGQQVRRLLATDPSAAWSMEQVAQETATSIPTLRRKLAAEGMAFRDLVQDVRMSHALALLQNTDAPVLHVAMAAGYASASRFSARFRARFGYLPTDIRGQNRGRTTSSFSSHRPPGAI
ncbi:AraC family transcriptional regulator [Pendulispora albinea]|uniref:AraC family transcriptional regulator n=1 Tax=Pendulispora albinea TaxID=2741071 RepID=A0ABZ2M047_9BACT